MNFKPALVAALLLSAAAPVANAAPAPVTSPVVAILNTVPLLGPTLANVTGVVGGAVSAVPVLGPSLGNLLGAPSLPGLPNVAQTLDQLPVVGATLSNLVNVVGTAVVGIPALGPVLGGALNGTVDLDGALPGLPSPTAFVGQLPVVGPLLQGKLLGG